MTLIKILLILAILTFGLLAFRGSKKDVYTRGVARVRRAGGDRRGGSASFIPTLLLAWQT